MSRRQRPNNPYRQDSYYGAWWELDAEVTHLRRVLFLKLTALLRFLRLG